MKKILITASLLVLLGSLVVACGGKGSSSNSSVIKGIALSNINDISNTHTTVGNLNTFNGTTIAGLFDGNFLYKLFNSIVGNAYASDLNTCSNFIAKNNSSSTLWKKIKLTDKDTDSSCVEAVRDIGRFIVLQTQNITAENGANCDLLLMRKSNGKTNCITLNINNRNETGNPKFYLDAQSVSTKNGNFFFVLFFTEGNTSSNYSGILRLNLTNDASPSWLIVDQLIGGINNFHGSVTISNNSAIYQLERIWPIENGDLVYRRNLVSDSAVNEKPSEFIYISVDENQSDPSLQKSILIAKSKSGASYDQDMALSPLALWWKSSHSEANAVGFDQELIPYNNFIDSSKRYFLISISSDQIIDSCNATQRLIKGTFNLSNNTLTFEDLGRYELGNGLGTHPETSNIYSTSDNSKLFSLYLQQDSNNQNINLIRREKNISFDCTYTDSIVYTDTSESRQLFPYNVMLQNGSSTIDTLDYVFLFNNNQFGFDCTDIWCKVNSNSLIYAAKKSDNSVVNKLDMSLIDFNANNFYLNGNFDFSLFNNKIYYYANDDKTTSAFINLSFDITPTGIQNIIKFHNLPKLLNSIIDI